MPDLDQRRYRAVVVRAEGGVAAPWQVQALRDLSDVSHNLDDPPDAGAHRLGPKADPDQATRLDDHLELFVAKVARLAARGLAFRSNAGVGNGERLLQQIESLADASLRQMRQVDHHPESLGLAEGDSSLRCQPVALTALVGARQSIVETM